MLHSGALVLLLAVASSQFNLYQSVMVVGTGVVDHSACPITYFGLKHSVLRITFEDSLFKICADEDNPDCLYLVDPQGAQASVEVMSHETGPGSLIHRKLHNIKLSSYCMLRIELKDSTNRTQLIFLVYNFGKQTALQFIPTSIFSLTELNITRVVPNNPVLSTIYPITDPQNGVVIDVSGCRLSGMVIPAGESKKFLKTCLNASCSPTADLTEGGLCGLTEICSTNIGCIPHLP